MEAAVAALVAALDSDAASKDTPPAAAKQAFSLHERGITGRVDIDVPNDVQSSPPTPPPARFLRNLVSASPGDAVLTAIRTELEHDYFDVSMPEDELMPLPPPIDVRQAARLQLADPATRACYADTAADEAREVPVETRGTSESTSSMLRAPARGTAFQRGSAANLPFLPGGIGADNRANAPADAAAAPAWLDVAAVLAGGDSGASLPPEMLPRAEQAVQAGPVVVGINAETIHAVVPADDDDIGADDRMQRDVMSAQDISEDRTTHRRQRPRAHISTLSYDNLFDDDDEHDDDVVVNADGVDASRDGGDSDHNDDVIASAAPMENEAAVAVDRTHEPRRRRDSIDELLGDADDSDAVAWVQQTRAAAAERERQTGGRTSDWALMTRMPMDDFHALVPDPALEYPFDLDDFQKEAIYHLEQGDCVFVAAHTSAGKTVVAEYAIALAARHVTRTLYTSPIKALSNQKFRDFRKTFGEVGLMTGDVTIDANAPCLILTTEILRSMLYRGADLIRDVEWVIFDEVHYVNDAERGVVWEEVIIMLPDHVNIIMLSATVPNTFEFADWVGRTKRKKVYVLGTDRRPVPLEHHIYTGNDMHKVIDASGKFLTLGYKKAMEASKEKEKKSGGRRGQPQASQYHALIEKLRKQSLLPVVVFCFSKKQCELYGYGLTGLDMTSSNEKSEIAVFINDAVSRLSLADQKLPQVLRIKDLLRRGVGVHHGGLLPIVKEMVEMLFGRGMIKVLFATETFAMGVNMPARAVVFHSTRKHDGTGMRDLLPGEYTQMSGRAGRRGLDKVGTVIVASWGPLPESSGFQKMAIGRPTRLESKFRLTYNMILNLLRVEQLRVEDMMKRSFSEADVARDAPKMEMQQQRAQRAMQSFAAIDCILGEPSIEEYYTLASERRAHARTLMEQEPRAQQFLRPGRVVRIDVHGHRAQVAVVREPGVRGRHVTVALPGAPGQEDTDILMDVRLVDIETIARERVRSDQPASQAARGSVTPLHPDKDMKLGRIDLVQGYMRRAALASEMADNKCASCPKLSEHYEQVHRQQRVAFQLGKLQHDLSDSSLALMPEYHARLRVLRRLRYVADDDGDGSGVSTVQLKGRVSCEINTCEELILVELIFENLFADLSPEECVAALSALVFQERNVSEPKIPERLQEVQKKMIQVASSLARVQQVCGLSEQSVHEFVRSNLNWGLVEVVYHWACGMPFRQLTVLTDVLEGSIVRCMTRLEESCRDVRNAARVIGDTALYEKMERASALIKRDIIFAASLYYT